MRVLGKVPESGDVAEVPVPDRSDPQEVRERLAALTVEHMDGLRVDRVSLRLLGPAATDTADTADSTDSPDQEGAHR